MSVRSYDFHGVAIDVDSDEEAVAEAIGGRLRHFRAIPSGNPDWRFELRVATAAHVVEPPQGMSRPVYDPAVGEVLYFPDDDVLWIDVEDRIKVHSARTRTRVSVRASALGELWLLSRPLFTIPLVEALKRHGLFNLHASAAALEGRVLLLPGTTGAGKSTLAVALARAGWEFLADDMVFLADDGDRLRVYGFSDEVDLSPESAAWFPSSTPAGVLRMAGRSTESGSTRRSPPGSRAAARRPRSRSRPQPPPNRARSSRSARMSRCSRSSRTCS